MLWVLQPAARSSDGEQDKDDKKPPKIRYKPGKSKQDSCWKRQHHSWLRRQWNHQLRQNDGDQQRHACQNQRGHNHWVDSGADQFTF